MNASTLSLFLQLPRQRSRLHLPRGLHRPLLFSRPRHLGQGRRDADERPCRLAWPFFWFSPWPTAEGRHRAGQSLASVESQSDRFPSSSLLTGSCAASASRFSPRSRFARSYPSRRPTLRYTLWTKTESRTFEHEAEFEPLPSVGDSIDAFFPAVEPYDVVRG